MVIPIAMTALIYAALLCVCGLMSLFGRMSMRLGAQVLGSGLEVMGPTPYFLEALLFMLSTWGVLRRRKWGRRLLILLCGIGIVLIVPHISSAVVDERWIAMSVDGVQILVRVAAASYLFREAEWFRP